MIPSKRDEYLGKVYVNNQGLKMKVVEYKNNKDVTVEFEDGALRKVGISNLKNGCIRHPNNLRKTSDEYLGQVYYNNQGLKMTVVRYNSSRDLTVRFEDGYEVETRLSGLLSGSIKNPYNPTVWGVGYIGIGKYNSKIDGSITKEYSVWTSILERCYSVDRCSKHITYEGCKVAEEWHNFQNFAEWYNKEYYNIGEPLDVDKDFKIKGNTIYSSEKCIMIPSKINKLARHRRSREYDYPIGVIKEKCGRFRSELSTYFGGKNRRNHLGTYDTPEEAFQAYKQAKEAYIQQVANEYKQKYGDKFPDKVYQAIMNYRVEITD